MHRRFAPVLALTAILLAPMPALTRGHSGSHSHSHSSSSSSHRSTAAKNAFKKSHPCPSTGATRGSCPGYVIDHVQALKRGGVDAPSNMQWQTKEAAKAKDKWE